MNFGKSGLHFKNEEKKKILLRNSKISNNSFNTNDTSYNNLNVNKKIKIEIDQKINTYNISINFYSVPPFGEISLNEAEEFFEERLKILNIISDMKENMIKYNSNSLNELTFRLKMVNDQKNFLNEINSNFSNKREQALRKDHVSHFLLRLYFCQNEELKKWFLLNEFKLLKYRLFLNSNFKSNLDEIISYNNLNYEKVDEIKKSSLFKEKNFNFNNQKLSTLSSLYKIPFEEALDLIKTRKVYLNNGYCYVLPFEMIFIVCTRFKLELSKSMASLHSHLPILEEKNRLLFRFDLIYNSFNKPKNNEIRKINYEEINIEMIDDLSKTAFPPCMRNMHETLRRDHHLRHYGRLQYGLFLKEIGLKIDDALQFFREEFIQKITPEKFQREYAYNIRYNYGKEGKKINQKAYNCAKIINSNPPGSGDTHGCPFQHFDKKNLIKMLKNHNLEENDITQINNLINNKSYTNACSLYFFAKNNHILEKEIYHPNQFFSERINISKAEYQLNQQKNINEITNDLK